VGTINHSHIVALSRLSLLFLLTGISMLAVVGYLVQESGARFPGAIDLSGTQFADIPNGYAGLEAVPLEVLVMRDFVGGEFPGDLRNNYIDFGWDSFDDVTKLRKRSIELNQGRAAMMGILALMVHEQLGVSLLPAAASSGYNF
jgi:Chlorophyll A-B binding protein